MNRNLQKHKTYLEMASTISKLSKDGKTKVGAVIVDSNGKIVSLGYNGAANGIDDSKIDYSGNVFNANINFDMDGKCCEFETQKNDYMIHAELNAILNTDDKKRLNNATCYITHYPCNNCANTLVQVGIKSVHVLDNLTNSGSKYINKSLWILENSNVDLYIYNNDYEKVKGKVRQ